MTVADAVLGFVEEKRALVARMEPFAPDAAHVMLAIVDELEELVRPLVPRWVGLADVQRRTGLSPATLRRRARELEGQGMARKGAGGRWEILRRAGAAIPARRSHDPLEGDVDELARRLGTEE